MNTHTTQPPLCSCGGWFCIRPSDSIVFPASANLKHICRKILNQFLNGGICNAF